MEGADQGFSKEGLKILQRRVGDQVQKFSHEGAPELDQGLLGRMRAHIAERGGQIVEGGIGLLGEGRGEGGV
ncbi:hypothetical protein D3C73_1258280 [compost metagenome]